MRWSFSPSLVLLWGALAFGTAACQQVETQSGAAQAPNYSRSTLVFSQQGNFVVGRAFTATFSALGPSRSVLERLTIADLEFVVSDPAALEVVAIERVEAGVFAAELLPLQPIRNAEIHVVLNGSPIAQTKKIFSVLATEVSSANSTLTADSPVVAADGSSHVTLTLTALNTDASPNSHGLENLNVSFETVGGTSAGIFLNPNVVGDGTYTVEFHGRRAGTPTSVRARIEGISIQQTVPITVSAGPAARIDLVSGDDQGPAPAGSLLPEPLRVRVLDGFMNPVPGASVTFTAAAGNGSIQPDNNGTIATETVSTDASGIAQAQWVLAGTLGTQTVSAGIGALQPVVFRAVSAPGTASSLNIVSGDFQTATVGRPLPKPLIVQVRDVHGNPVPNVNVAWSVTSGGGALSAATSKTDSAGKAEMAWTMGPSVSQQEVTAHVPNTSYSYVFRAVSSPGPAAQVAVVSGNQPHLQAPVFINGVLSFVAEVQDAFGNPVENTSVKWNVIIGDGTILESDDKSDGNGRVKALFRVGPTAGLSAVTVAVGSSAALFTVESVALSFDKIEIVSGNGQTGPVSGPAPQELVVEATDAQGNPIPNVLITWTIVSAPELPSPQPNTAALSAGTSRTNTNGRASISYTLGSHTGTNTVRARSVEDYDACSTPACRNRASKDFTITGTWDQDVQIYMARSGMNHISDTDKYRINSFVTGLKREGLWSKLREMWFLRAGQNTTSTDKVYGFLGVSDGTIVGNPNDLRKDSGVGSDGTGNPPPHVNLPNTKRTNYATRTLLMTLVKRGTTDDDVFALTSNNSFDLASSGSGFKIGTSVWWGEEENYDSVARLPLPTGGTASMLAASFEAAVNGGRVVSYLNGGSILDRQVPFNRVSDTNSIRLMANQGGARDNRGLNGEVSFFADFIETLSAQQIQTLYELYHSTAGQDLTW